MVDPIEINDALEQTEALIRAHDIDGAAAYLRSLHPADSAEVLRQLEPEEQAAIAARIQPLELADIFEQLDEDDAAEMAEHLDTETLADVLDKMEPDMAVDLLGELEDEEVDELLAEMEDASEVEHLLPYDEDTAGGIMNYPPPSLRRWMTVSQAFEYIREHYVDEEELLYLYVLDRHDVLIGVVRLRALILARADQTIEEIMDPDVISVSVDEDQEEVAQLLARYDLLAIPVVDDQHRFVGVITVDDVIDVIEDEATEDIYRLAQVSEDAEIFSPIPRAIRNRAPWLYMNLATALISASIVTFFEGTIALVPVLAAFMPVVAAQGGNSGNQTMTIVVRSLALGEISLKDTWKALGHEITVGILHGLMLGLTLGVVAYLWHGNIILSAVITLSMLITIFVSALAGVLVPATLEKLGVDPALASSMFVTASTDMTGFATFLGLATVAVHLLVK